jgi:hypothetical protein
MEWAAADHVGERRERAAQLEFDGGPDGVTDSQSEQGAEGTIEIRHVNVGKGPFLSGVAGRLTGMPAKVKSRPRAKSKATRKPKSKADDVKLPKAVLRDIDERVDRYIGRWARRLIIVVDGQVRRLNEEELEAIDATGKKGRKRVRQRG